MWTLVIVINEPGIQVDLKDFDRFVKPGAEGSPEELIQNGPLKPGYKAIGSRPTDLSEVMFNVVELRVELKGVGGGAASQTTNYQNGVSVEQICSQLTL